MSELVTGIMSIFVPILDGMELFLSFFIRDDLVIFGLPYYQWAIGLLFVGLLANMFIGLGGDD